MSLLPSIKHFIFSNHNRLMIVLAFLIGIFYVGNTWTPSSYERALSSFGAKKLGLVEGHARASRSDEWAIITPYTQAAVNSNFERYNKTSVYQEDLRSVFSVPIFDWGFVFKPNMWLYPLVNPAYAFSFYHYSYIAMFILGFAFLFQHFGASQKFSFLIALTLFFTSYMQYWWTTFGHVSASFPWMLMIIINRKMRLSIRATLFYWVATSWLLSSHFYPPLFIQAAFVALLLALAFRPHLFKIPFLIWFGASGILAVLTALFYLRDPLLAMLTTLFPGQRVSGGGGIPPGLWISQFLPTSQVQRHVALLAGNPPESGVLGSYYFLLVWCFIDYRQIRKMGAVINRRILILGLGLVAVWSWMFFYLPPWVGMPLLWDRIPPYRMWFASGFLMLTITFLVANQARLKVNILRLLIFSVLILGGTYHYKVLRSGFPWDKLALDFAIVLPAIWLYVIRKKLSMESFHSKVLWISLIFSMASFGNFNPIQSAWPVFNRPETEVTRSLDLLLKEDGEKLAVGGFAGATLNGWGYPSISHVTGVPPLEHWRSVFPELPEEEFNTIFNRTAYFILRDEKHPYLMQTDAIGVPIDTFVRWAHQRSPKVGTTPMIATQKKGSIDKVVCEGKNLNIRGWAPWNQQNEQQSLHIYSNTPLNPGLDLKTRVRMDVVKSLKDSNLMQSGFFLTATLEETCQPEKISVCLIAEDSDGKKSLLGNSNETLCTKEQIQ